MKRTLITLLVIASMLLILDSINFSHALMMFLLAGVIPGTNIAIDGAQMLTLIALVVGFTLGRLTASFVKSISSIIIRPATKVQEA